MIRIGLVGLPYDDNLGDPLMIECVKRICEKQFASNSNDDFEFEMIDLMARENNEEIPYKRSLGYYYYKFKKKLTRENIKVTKLRLLIRVSINFLKFIIKKSFKKLILL